MPQIDLVSLDLQDALDLAISIEEEAQERYAEFSRMTGAGYAGDAADVFASLAVAEATVSGSPSSDAFCS